MGNNHRLAETDMRSQGRDVRCVLFSAMAVPGCRRTPHTTPVHTQNAITVREVADLMIPVTQIGAPAMDKNQRRSAALGARDFEVKLRAIVSGKGGHGCILCADA